ncbi:MAG: hypothetical protein V1793_07225 [Pseudomonadota bacterium]
MGKKLLHAASLILSIVIILGFSSMALALEAYIPHITGAGNDDWKDSLQVDNTGLVNASFDLTLYNNGAVVYGPTSYTVSRLSESSPINLKTLAPSASWGMISYSSQALVFRACYEYKGGPAAEFTLSDTLGGSLGFFFSTFSTNGVSKGIAVTNTDSVPAVATAFALGGGSVLGTAPVTIPARSRILAAYTIDGWKTDWLPAASFSTIQKIILVSSSPYLCGITMQGLKKDADQLANLLFTAAKPVTDFSAGSSDLTGTWDGTWQSTMSPGDSGGVTMYLTQTGSVFTGTMDVTDTDIGDVPDVPIGGTIIDNVVTLNASYVFLGHLVTLQYTSGTISGDTITGSYTQNVSGYPSPYDTGTFSVTKLQ